MGKSTMSFYTIFVAKNVCKHSPIHSLHQLKHVHINDYYHNNIAMYIPIWGAVCVKIFRNAKIYISSQIYGAPALDM